MNYRNLFLLITPFVAVGCAAGPANADDTRNVETNVSISASPERVLRAFVDHEDLHGWWSVSRSFVEDRPGGVWSVTWDDYGEDRTQHAWIGVVEEISPRRLRIGHLVMIEPDRPLFGPLQIEVVVAPIKGGTSLTVFHRGYQYGDQWNWMYETVVRGWKHVLADMQAWFRDGETLNLSLLPDGSNARDPLRLGGSRLVY